MGNNKNPRIHFNCWYCGRLSSDKPSAYKRKKRHFCQQECYSYYRMSILPKEEHNRFGKGLPIDIRLERRKARTILNHAVRDGKLKRPSSCSDCRKKCKPEAHHFDYLRPVDVRWLCHKCHHKPEYRVIYENPLAISDEQSEE